MFGLKKNRESLFSAIAQIGVLLIISGMVTRIIDTKTFMAYLQGIPLFEIWTDVLYQSQTVTLNSVVWIYLSAFIDALIMGICIYVAKSFGDLLQMKGPPILSTFVGISVGSIFIKILGIKESFALVVIVALMILGILMMLKGVFRKLKLFDVTSFLILLIDSILAVIMAGYVVALLMFRQGNLAVHKMVSIILFASAALILVWLISWIMNKEKK